MVYVSFFFVRIRGWHAHQIVSCFFLIVQLHYVDNDTELPTLTPNSVIYGHSIRGPENESDDDDTNLLKRQRYIKRCKQSAWNRWKNDYLRALRERHDMKHKPSQKKLKRRGHCHNEI